MGTKIRLVLGDTTSNFFEESRMLGIVAPLKDYNFIWNLNNYLGFNMRLNTQIEIALIKKDRKYFFTIYDYKVPGTQLTHYLYSNQNDGEYLLPEFKHLDFLWLTKDEFVEDTSVSRLIQSIRKIPSVQLVSELPMDKIKNKQHLIF